MRNISGIFTKRTLLTLVLAVSSFTMVFMGGQRSAHAACTVLEVYGPWTGLVDFVAGHSYTEIYDNFATPGIEYTNTWTASSSGPGFWGIPSNSHDLLIDNSCSGGVALPLFNDGRENKNDAIQTAAVYCGVPHDGDVRVYTLYNNIGTIAFTVTKTELAAGVQKPTTPYLIKSGKGAELWRLQDGSLRIKRATYVFDWPGC